MRKFSIISLLMLLLTSAPSRAQDSIPVFSIAIRPSSFGIPYQIRKTLSPTEKGYDFLADHKGFGIEFRSNLRVFYKQKWGLSFELGFGGSISNKDNGFIDFLTTAFPDYYIGTPFLGSSSSDLWLAGFGRRFPVKKKWFAECWAQLGQRKSSNASFHSTFKRKGSNDFIQVIYTPDVSKQLTYEVRSDLIYRDQLGTRGKMMMEMGFSLCMDYWQDAFTVNYSEQRWGEASAKRSSFDVKTRSFSAGLYLLLSFSWH